MATFVLVHGSFHAAWNWHRLVPLLEAAGHRALPIDLPGHGRDRTPVAQITLASCAAAVLRAMDRADEPVVLVAHSRSGIVISEVAEAAPERVAGLVYLAAYLVPDGRSMMEYARLDPESLVAQNIVGAPPPWLVARMIPGLRHGLARWLAARLLPARFQSHRLDRRAHFEALYHDCPPEITRLADVLMEAEPNAPGFTPLRLTADRYGRVPRVYVACRQDRAVTYALQARMWTETPCARVIELDTGHSPFFSDPPALRDALREALAVFAP